MRRLIGALLAVLTIVPAGCGVPNDSQPRALRAADIPLQLNSQAPPVEAGPGQVTLFFVRDQTVAQVQRSVPQRPTDQGAMQLLFKGPTDAEKAAGFSSLLVGVTLDGVRVDNGVAVVSLSGTADQLGPEAYAQIVATLTPRRADGVRFRLNGKDLDVLRGNNSVSTEPLDRNDYAQVLATPSPSSRAAAPEPASVTGAAPSTPLAPSP